VSWVWAPAACCILLSAPRKNALASFFIDEVDAVLAVSAARSAAANDEREQTSTAAHRKMDGLEENSG